MLGVGVPTARDDFECDLDKQLTENFSSDFTALRIPFSAEELAAEQAQSAVPHAERRAIPSAAAGEPGGGFDRERVPSDTFSGFSYVPDSFLNDAAPNGGARSAVMSTVPMSTEA